MGEPDLLFGNYLACEPLARGGFGQVYRGEHRYLRQRIVAIKVMRDAPLQTQREREEFLREASILELLKHPSILPILDVGIQENVPYLVTEYAPAGSLRQRLQTRRGQPLPLDEALHILHQIASALHFAHEHQIIHRDLKPDNILFNARGEALLADFGIATLIGTASYRQTRVIGTPAYMAPEQFRGQVCKESDQYALACLAYELFIGRPPFANPTQPLDFYALMFHHVQEHPQLPIQLNPDLPTHISTALMKALAKDRAMRYSDVLAFVAELLVTLGSESITQTQPDIADLLEAGKNFLDQQRYQEAIKVCDRAIQLDPNSIMAYMSKGRALDASGYYEEALDAYDRAIELGPDNDDAYFNRGNILDELGRYEEALLAYERVIKLCPNDMSAHNNKGYVLNTPGRYEEALVSCDRAIQLDSGYAAAYHTKAEILNALGRHKEARKVYDLARGLGWEA